MTIEELRASVEGVARRFHVPGVELRAEGDGNRNLIGHAAIFDHLSEDLGGFREQIKRGAFRKVLDASQDVRLLVNHTGMPLARTSSGTLELREDPKGLHVHAVAGSGPSWLDVLDAMDRRDIDQMSFGFKVAKGGDHWEQRDGQVTRTISEFSELFDVSIVTFPAYPQTDASLRALEAIDELTRALSKSGAGHTPTPAVEPPEAGAATGDGDAVAVPDAPDGEGEARTLTVARARRRLTLIEMGVPRDTTSRQEHQ